MRRKASGQAGAKGIQVLLKTEAEPRQEPSESISGAQMGYRLALCGEYAEINKHAHSEGRKI